MARYRYHFMMEFEDSVRIDKRAVSEYLEDAIAKQAKTAMLCLPGKADEPPELFAPDRDTIRVTHVKVEKIRD